MAVFNAAKREIDIKIVYYGPALCGKTTNVQCIHRMLAPQQRGELMSLATKDDRTLFFDFLPIELGDVKGFKTRFHVYTVPGQVYYALTRRAVLTGVDGIVFVADSQKNKLQENIESLNDLNDNLKYYKKDLASVPFIIQYNKRDLDGILSVAELNTTLNTMNVPFYAASALQGTGVVETLTAVCKLVLKQMDKTSGKKPKPQAAPPPRIAEVAAPAPPPDQSPETTEPIFKIFNDEVPAAAPQQEPATAPAGGIDSFPGVDVSMPRIESLRLEEQAPGSPNEPEININTSYVPVDLAAPSLSFDEQKLSGDFSSYGMPAGQEPELRIVACGQAQKISEKMLKLPVTVTIGQPERECTLTITISFDDIKLKG